MLPVTISARTFTEIFEIGDVSQSSGSCLLEPLVAVNQGLNEQRKGSSLQEP